jgi:hypothetical protein
MGLFCIDHEAAPVGEMPRGRPWPPEQAEADGLDRAEERILIPERS